MPERDYSQMPVHFDTESTSVVRCVRVHGFSLAPGTYVDVEVGATWATIAGRQERIGGQWRQCVVTRVEHSTVYVRLAPRPEDDLVCWDCGTPIVMHADGAEKPCGHSGTLVVTRARWEQSRAQRS